MKRTLIVLSVFLMAATTTESCDGPQPPPIATSSGTVFIDRQLGDTIRTVTYRDHEYVIAGGEDVSGICHSASCPCTTRPVRLESQSP